MRHATVARLMVISTVVITAASATTGGELPPGRRHVLSIDGENTVTFVPQANLAPLRIDYHARVEYIVNTRTGDEALATKKTGGKNAVTAKNKRKAGGAPVAKAVTTLDLAIHSSEMKFNQNGQTVVESRISHSGFEGRLQPDAPIVTLSSNNAPPRLYELMKTFDTTVASLLLDDSSKVLQRKVRHELPQRPLIETLLSIHTPIPRDAAFWTAPTQLAMGHGQTAKGTLRFDKNKESLAATGGLVKVKVSGMLKAEGVVAERFIKEGRYTVTGEQTYDPGSREWRSARWSVAVDNELANPVGLTVAHAQGTMIVESKIASESSSTGDPPKL
jgi:hypothetical protein